MEEQSTRAKTDRGGPLAVSVKDLSQHACACPLRLLGVLHRAPWLLHRVLGVLHRVPGLLHRVLGVLHRVLGVLHYGCMPPALGGGDRVLTTTRLRRQNGGFPGAALGDPRREKGAAGGEEKKRGTSLLRKTSPRAWRWHPGAQARKGSRH